MTFLVPAKSHAALESYSDQCIQIISYLFSIRQNNSANEGLKLLLCMVKPYTLHVAGPRAELVKSGWRNLLESREALWREAGFLSPIITVWGQSEALVLGQFVRALVPSPSVYVPMSWRDLHVKQIQLNEKTAPGSSQHF